MKISNLTQCSCLELVTDDGVLLLSVGCLSCMWVVTNVGWNVQEQRNASGSDMTQHF
jgi:hypothetical protein